MEVVNCISLWMFGFIFTLESSFTSGISVNVDPVKPALGNSMTVTCQRSSSSTSSISWSVDSTILTTCDGTRDNFCIPSSPGHTFSTNVLANEFNLALASITIADCKTYTCTDTGNSETISKNIQLADYRKNDISQTEPGANTDGSISITTGCVLSPDDLTITWFKIVNGNSVDFSTDDPSPVTSTNKSACTRTCHTEEDKTVTSGFTHTEYTGKDSVTVQYMVYVSHSSYPDNTDIFTWTSANYTLKQAPTQAPTQEIYDCPGLGNSKLVDSEGKCFAAWMGICCVIFLVAFLIGIVLGCILKCATCCCDSFNNGESCKDYVNNCYCMCQCCDKTPCSALCNIRDLPYWYQVLWATVIGSPVALGIWMVWKCCPNGMRKKYMQDDKFDLLDDGNTKNDVRPQHPPPPGSSLNNRQLPDIHDKKGRGLPANYTHDDYTLVSINIPTKKPGALESIPDSAREEVKKKKKKRKRRVDTEDDQSI